VTGQSNAICIDSARQISCRLCSADSNDVGVRGNTGIADVDVVTACRNVITGLITNGYVINAFRDGIKCLEAIGGVVTAGRVVEKRPTAVGRVVRAAYSQIARPDT